MQTSTFAIAAAMGTTATVAAADTWQLLDQIDIQEIVTETTYEVKKSYPGALSGDNIDVEISGYARPTLPGDTVQELILVADMGLCPYCGSVDHTSSLVVSLADPIPVMDETQRITLRGTLQKVEDSETWQAVILKDAQVIAQ